MRDVYTTLSGFSVEQVTPLGEISLLIIVGETPHHRRMIPSMMHSAVLYQSEAGPWVIMSEFQDVRRCELLKRLKETPLEAPILRIGRTNFATEHKLNENKKVTHVQQKNMRMAPERASAASKEVEELRKAGILKETRYQTYVANTLTKKVLVENLAKKSIHEKQIAEAIVEEKNSWMTPIIEYLVSDILPADKKLERKVRVKAPIYRMIGGILYKRYFLTPWLRCVGPKQGIDIVGPLPEAPERVKFLIVAVDYFTKWVEAKPLANFTRKHVERFVWEHIVTSLKRSHGESPFSHTYGTENVLLIEISIPTKRTKQVDPAQNEKDLKINLEVLEEKREITAIREAVYKKKLEKYYNNKVRLSTYKPEDYVLRLYGASKVEYTRNMGPTWEGPYKVLEADGIGAYVLSTLKGRIIPRTWNGVNLQKYYM
ncbi:reverse transcriptase domain-containing protein [Tanacetum coccineum]